MLHEPAAASTERDHASGQKAKIGIGLFIFYSLVYAGFVAINVFKPQWMEIKTLMGMNLAVLYGFGLIILAIVMGLIYNHLCGRLEDTLNQPASNSEASK